MKTKKPIITELLNELHSGYSDNKAPLHKQDIYFILPIANQAIELEKGIDKMVLDKNFICAASLTRSLLECSLVLAYALSFHELNKEIEEEEFFDKFLENGRMQKYYKKRWRNVRDIDLLDVFNILFHIDIQSDYDSLCNILHYSKSHITLPIKSMEGGKFQVNIGYNKSFVNVTEEQQDWIVRIKKLMIDTICFNIAAEINGRRMYNEIEVSKVAMAAQSYWISEYGTRKSN
ncbi:hypothetical protein ACI1T5_05290 [Lactococcus petauri]|uniref:hypothetical protein n=1 Tax=Lactococcus petauri TaxID=1940789 RepID=UPI00129E3629|nr:hypothetical protein [Lactococcus petauri]